MRKMDEEVISNDWTLNSVSHSESGSKIYTAK